jgi:hypothetical protein
MLHRYTMRVLSYNPCRYRVADLSISNKTLRETHKQLPDGNISYIDDRLPIAKIKHQDTVKFLVSSVGLYVVTLLVLL